MASPAAPAAVARDGRRNELRVFRAGQIPREERSWRTGTQQEFLHVGFWVWGEAEDPGAQVWMWLPSKSSHPFQQSSLAARRELSIHNNWINLRFMMRVWALT